MEDPVYLSDELVLSRMLISEKKQEIASYFDNQFQLDFNESDRRELAVWMRDVCLAEECQPDVLLLAIKIVDKFLSLVRTKRSQLQLLGSVALLLASKLRQTNHISVKLLIYYTQELVTFDELITWEFYVLTALKWDLAFVTPVDYLDILMERLKSSHSINEELADEIQAEACELIFQCSLEFEYLVYHPPSSIAWVCLTRALKKVNRSFSGSNQVYHDHLCPLKLETLACGRVMRLRQ